METDGDEALAKQGNILKVVKVQNGGEHHDAGSGGAAANGVHEENGHATEGNSRTGHIKAKTTLKENGIKGRIRSSGCLRIFTVAVLLFLAPARAVTLWDQFPNPAGHSLILN